MLLLYFRAARKNSIQSVPWFLSNKNGGLIFWHNISQKKFCWSVVVCVLFGQSVYWPGNVFGHGCVALSTCRLRYWLLLLSSWLSTSLGSSNVWHDVVTQLVIWMVDKKSDFVWKCFVEAHRCSCYHGEIVGNIIYFVLRRIGPWACYSYGLIGILQSLCNVFGVIGSRETSLSERASISIVSTNFIFRRES